MLTASQSVFGVACLIDLKFDRLEGVLLLGVFLFQFFVPIVRLEISVVYLILPPSRSSRVGRRFAGRTF